MVRGTNDSTPPLNHGSIRDRYDFREESLHGGIGQTAERPPDQTAVERDELADLYDRRLQQASCDLVLRGKTDIPRSQGRWTD